MPTCPDSTPARRAALGLSACAVAIALGAAGGAPREPARSPELPRATVDTTMPPPPRRVLRIARGGDLNDALAQARPGDRISIEAGAEFTGPFTLPKKDGDGWIVVASSAIDHGLPPPGSRVAPSDAGAMPRLVSRSGAVLAAAKGAHHYRFVGIDIGPAAGTALANVVELGGGSRTKDELPHHIVFDRCFVHGDPRRGSRRGIALNGAALAVIDSYLSEFKEVGADSQAVCGWAGPGPFKLENNELQAAGENVMFGGADPFIPGLVPSDIEILRNHIAKPLALKADEPGFERVPWSVKNLLELKNARRVLIEGNLLEASWAAAQKGFAVLFTVRNQEGSAPWSVVEDVTFRRNLLKGAGSGINILGRDDLGGESRRTSRIAIEDNVFLDIGGPRWGGAGTLFQLLAGASDVVIEHNTGFQTGAIVMAEGAPTERFVFRGNVARRSASGIVGSGTAPGRSTLERYFPGSLVAGNVDPDPIDPAAYLRRTRGKTRPAAGADPSALREALGAGAKDLAVR